MKVRVAVINTLALLVLPVAVANALTLYEDPATGQVFTQPGAGRVEVDYLPDAQEAAADGKKTVALDEDVQAAIDDSVQDQIVKENPVKASYGEKGFRLETRDGNFSTNLQWRAQFRYSNPRGSDPRQLDDFEQETTSNFEPRRLRMKIGGHGFQPWLKYYFEVDLQPARDVEADPQSSAARVITWRAEINKWEPLSFTVGQWKINYNRERVDSSGRQQFVERSIVNRVVTLDRQVGIQANGRLFKGTPADMHYYAGIYNGEGRSVANIGDDHMYMGRLQWNFFGRELKWRQSDVKFHEKPTANLAFGGSTNTGPCTRWSSSGCGNLDGFLKPADQVANDLTDQYEISQAVQEFAFKWRGWSIQQEWHRKFIEDKYGNTDAGLGALSAPGSKYDLTGFYAQTGYFFHNIWKFIPEKMEFAGRYAYVKEPNETELFIHNERTEATAAINYFFSGHNNKLTLDYSYLTLDDGLANVKENEDRVRLQWDVSF